jgi:hypothetical protein
MEDSKDFHELEPKWQIALVIALTCYATFIIYILIEFKKTLL